MRKLCLAVVFIALAFAYRSQPTPAQEAPAAFDDNSNGMVDGATHAADRKAFDDVETIADGLGPLYNAQSCRECHQNPTSGGASQVTELRVGHRTPNGRFVNPDLPIAGGTVILKNRSLVNDRAICPSGQYPDQEIQQRVPQSENVRTLRMSLSLFGDGFVEALADQTLLDLASEQCKSSHGRICGETVKVPIVEAPGQLGVGRFGWKDQHASLVSFSADAYLNEMGITSSLQPDEVTSLCNTAKEPNDQPDADGVSDFDRFARFIRATKAPARDTKLSATAPAQRGSALFDQVGCAVCHVRNLTTAAMGTKVNGGAFTVPDALGGKTFHPFGDFLLHDVGTGDGIIQTAQEHYGRRTKMLFHDMPEEGYRSTANKLRTAPLWGVRLRPRLMHDGLSLTFEDAVLRHQGEAGRVTLKFRQLSRQDKDALVEFLRSL